MQFKDVIGHFPVKQHLIKSVKSGRVSHAQLFLGTGGYGGLPLALAYAQYINCENRDEHDSCGRCSGCNKYSKFIHPDLHFVYPVNTTKSKTGTLVSDDFVTEWRNCLQQNPYVSSSQWYEFIGLENKQGIISKHESQEIIRKINLKTYESTYKIMIVWLPEKMNEVAANKLLKLIEEPPENTLFLLVSESTATILPTILSRTQLLKIPKIMKDDLSAAIQVRHGLSEEESKQVAHLANGSYNAAREVIETSENNRMNLEKFIEIMRLCYSRKLTDIFAWVDEMAALGREKQKQFFEFALRLIRENLILNTQQTELVFLTNEEMKFSGKFHPFINGRNVIPITREFNKAAEDIERNGYNKIVLLDMCLKLVKLIKK
ncbi:MAG: DNA polymerase III subunit delta [Bacteroidetes bacterium]|jgi:DNA polymerase-3 subunit delta'|nr:DNA polymerase III subunit delta [Bacteroidota bacterium]